MRGLAMAACFFFAVLAASSARAQQPAGDDVVELRGGGMLRGTIAENLPGDHVTIVLITGETRTVPAAEVRYAGPAASAPSTAPQYVIPPAPEGAASPVAPGTPGAPPSPFPAITPQPAQSAVPIRVRSDLPGLTLQVTTGQRTQMGYTYSPGFRGFGPSFMPYTQQLYSYARLCTAPCDAQLAIGAYDFAIGVGSGDPIRTGTLVDVLGPSTLWLRFESREPLRLVGVIGTVAAIVVMIAGTVVGLSATTEPNQLAAAATIGGGIVGALVFPWFLLFNDLARVEVTPLG